MGQFSRTDSLLFKDRSFTYTLDLIDLVMQIQPAQKGWTLKPGVSVKQCKMFHFWMLNPSLVRKVWCTKSNYSHLVFFSILASIMQIPPARKWKVYEDNESIITQR